MDAFQKIKNFVIQQRWEFKEELTENTDLRRDLQLWGDDAFEFLVSFSREFNVDISDFVFSKYFPPEGDRLVPKLLGFIGLNPEPEYHSLTLGDLLSAIVNGKLR